MLRYFNLKPSLKLLWCRSRELFGSQLPVTTGGFELQISWIWVLSIRLAYQALWSSGLSNCKRFSVQTLLWQLEFVVQIILEHDTTRELTLTGCFEISISVIVKHVPSIGIIRVFCLPGETCQKFQCLRDQKKLLGCGLLGGSVPRQTL